MCYRPLARTAQASSRASLSRASILPSNDLTMRPADAYRLKYRSSSQDSTEPLGVGRVARALEPSRPTETNETAELRALALEADEIGRAARESRRRAAHMQLPPPHKLEE